MAFSPHPHGVSPSPSGMMSPSLVSNYSDTQFAGHRNIRRHPDYYLGGDVVFYVREARHQPLHEC
jgi:hypothetical protein